MPQQPPQTQKHATPCIRHLIVVIPTLRHVELQRHGYSREADRRKSSAYTKHYSGSHALAVHEPGQALPAKSNK